ncbi:hypothetical protein A6I86_16580 [Prescottella equi]|nr:hypothetical protein A6I86_16580 [Prescottella equi]ORL31229.1 hypothetical protein A6I87_23935 [Prescottella equi]
MLMPGGGFVESASDGVLGGSSKAELTVPDLVDRMRLPAAVTTNATAKVRGMRARLDEIERASANTTRTMLASVAMSHRTVFKWGSRCAGAGMERL